MSFSSLQKQILLSSHKKYTHLHLGTNVHLVSILTWTNTTRSTVRTSGWRNNRLDFKTIQVSNFHCILRRAWTRPGNGLPRNVVHYENKTCLMLISLSFSFDDSLAYFHHHCWSGIVKGILMKRIVLFVLWNMFIYYFSYF